MSIHAPFACQCGGTLTPGCPGYPPGEPLPDQPPSPPDHTEAALDKLREALTYTSDDELLRCRPCGRPVGNADGCGAAEALDALRAERDALLEVAQAAQAIMYAEFENADEVLVPKDDFATLCAALARLNRDTT